MHVLRGLRRREDQEGPGLARVARLPQVAKALGDAARLWVAYPKAKKLGTDLNRDVLVRQLKPHGLDPCRRVSIDDTWSAMWVERA